MVIDMLNIPAQTRLQHDTFGGLSDQIQDYEDIGFAERIDSDRGRELLEIVDPYRYRASPTQPKLILLGTNDRYWPLDALSAYWDACATLRHMATAITTKAIAVKRQLLLECAKPVPIKTITYILTCIRRGKARLIYRH